MCQLALTVFLGLKIYSRNLWLVTDLDHWHGLDGILFADPGAETACEYLS
jgi:hypothetical protein